MRVYDGCRGYPALPGVAAVRVLRSYCYVRFNTEVTSRASVGTNVTGYPTTSKKGFKY